MSKHDSKNVLLGIAWSGGITATVALLTLIAGAGSVPQWAVIALGGIGTVSFFIVAKIHGWLNAPYWFGVPLRVTIVIGGIVGVMFFLCWTAWPPIRRHVLSEEEKALFEAPLKRQTDDRYEIQITCPATEETACVYAAQFIPLFKEAGWKVPTNQVERVTLGTPYEGIRIFEYVDQYPDPNAPPNTGVWALMSPSLVSTYKAFSSVGIEPDEGIRKDVKPNVLTVYFGSERTDESKPTPLTQTMEQLPEIKRQNPKSKLP